MKLKKDSYSVGQQSKKNGIDGGHVNKGFSDENKANIDKSDTKKYPITI
jgi:hypothetical protein